MHEVVSLLSEEGLSRTEALALSRNEMLLYRAQAEFHREKKLLARQMELCQTQIAFSDEAADKINSRFEKLKSQLAQAEREFYGRY